MVSSVELRQERRSLVEQMRNLVSRAEAEKRGLDGLETEQWEKLDAASNALDVRIERLERVSKPGLRVYRGKEAIPKVMDGLGVAIVSTPRGVMTDRRARANGVGGEVLAFVA
ncbi:MAG: 30S ribosomal protein S8, partial [Betaproteobacteria bacterium]|nr:30S ribosomal protein S8 [Betaproteobacteria bacterium]